MSYSEVKKLPVRYRRWFLDRLAEEFKNQADVRKAAHSNTPSPERSQISELPFGEMNEFSSAFFQSASALCKHSCSAQQFCLWNPVLGR